MDPQAFIAPPRTDYDYSPLDLAPPGQRRRRQLIAGAIGALSVLLLGALVVFGWVILRDDDPATDNNLAAVATEAANDNEEAPAVAGTPEPAEPTAPPAQDVTPTEPPADEPAQDEAAGPVIETDAGSLAQRLPTQEMLPPGFDTGTDSERTQEEVVTALGGGRPAEQNLDNWGWTANVERTFINPAPEAGATSSITVSLHGFQDPQSAAEALPFFADILLNIGYEDIEPPPLGENARLLTQPQEDGGVIVALYVQDGPVLYRFGGYSLGGDPSQDVINVATEMLAGE